MFKRTNLLEIVFGVANSFVRLTEATGSHSRRRVRLEDARRAFARVAVAVHRLTHHRVSALVARSLHFAEDALHLPTELVEVAVERREAEAGQFAIESSAQVLRHVAVR